MIYKRKGQFFNIVCIAIDTRNINQWNQLFSEIDEGLMISRSFIYKSTYTSGFVKYIYNLYK